MFLKGKEVLVLKRCIIGIKLSCLRHIWNLFTRAGSLWIAWVKMFLLRGKGLWQIKSLHLVLGKTLKALGFGKEVYTI